MRIGPDVVGKDVHDCLDLTNVEFTKISLLVKIIEVLLECIWDKCYIHSLSGHPRFCLNVDTWGQAAFGGNEAWYLHYGQCCDEGLAPLFQPLPLLCSLKGHSLHHKHFTITVCQSVSQSGTIRDRQYCRWALLEYEEFWNGNILSFSSIVCTIFPWPRCTLSPCRTPLQGLLSFSTAALIAEWIRVYTLDQLVMQEVSVLQILGRDISPRLDLSGYAYRAILVNGLFISEKQCMFGLRMRLRAFNGSTLAKIGGHEEFLRLLANWIVVHGWLYQIAPLAASALSKHHAEWSHVFSTNLINLCRLKKWTLFNGFSCWQARLAM